MNEFHTTLTGSPDAVSSTLVDSPKRTHQPTAPDKRGILLEADGVDDLICFSHLRWNFVYQRPQHLLSRAARACRVWYMEEPIWAKRSYQSGLHSLT